MAASTWTAMADILTFPNACVSSCFTLNPQEAQGKEFINRLSSQFFFAKALTSAASSSYAKEMDKSCQNRRQAYLSMKILNVSEFLSPKFLAHDAEFKRAVKVLSSHFSYRSNVNMKSLFLAMFLDNAIVKEHSLTKDKVSYYINYEIACF